MNFDNILIRDIPWLKRKGRELLSLSGDKKNTLKRQIQDKITVSQSIVNERRDLKPTISYADKLPVCQKKLKLSI